MSLTWYCCILQVRKKLPHFKEEKKSRFWNQFRIECISTFAKHFSKQTWSLSHPRQWAVPERGSLQAPGGFTRTRPQQLWEPQALGHQGAGGHRPPPLTASHPHEAAGREEFNQKQYTAMPSLWWWQILSGQLFVKRCQRQTLLQSLQTGKVCREGNFFAV